MTMHVENSRLTTAHSGVARQSVHSFRSLRWLNGSVHWISAVVLVYAFISNGETTHAMKNPAAMGGEVKLGLIVGVTGILTVSVAAGRMLPEESLDQVYWSTIQFALGAVLLISLRG